MDGITQQKSRWRERKAEDSTLGDTLNGQAEEEEVIKPGAKA